MCPWQLAKRSNIITLNIHVCYEVSECRMSVRICTVYRIESQINIFVHRYSKYMCTAISRRLYVCHNFGTLKKEGGGISSFIYTNTSLWPTCTVTSSNNWAREGFKCLPIYTKKNQHWYSRSFFTVVSLCNTILIIKSHSNFAHCHSSPPWWLVPKMTTLVMWHAILQDFWMVFRKGYNFFRKPGLFPFWGNESKESSALSLR